MWPEAILAGVSTPVADQVPVEQRAEVSGWTGIMHFDIKSGEATRPAR